MARMYPNVEPSELEHASEAEVYVALRDQLSDEYIVLHSYPWLRRRRGDALVEGEADFIIAHPSRGMLILEVKGGVEIKYEQRRWYRQTNGGPRYFKDPFEQGRRNMHALLDIIRERTGGRLQRGDIVYGYAVVFPHMDYEALPPPHADRAIILSARHLTMMEQAIEVAFDAWTDEARPLSRGQFQTLVSDCLMPRFKIFRPVGPDIAEASERLLELTEVQAQVFEGLYAHERVLVEGVAGSGKTLLALHRALAFARAGRRTLFVCFNKDLAAWIRRQVSEDATTADYRSLLMVRHFHGLAAELAAKAGIAFAPADGGRFTSAFWNDEVADLMDQAIIELTMGGEEVHLDAIVVDEGQDFCLSWWYVLTQSLLAEPDGPLYIFMDPNQSLRQEVRLPEVELATRFELTMNCRNTRRVARASASVLELEARTFSRAPAGAAVRVLKATSQRQQKGLVMSELRRLLQREGLTPDQVVLIGPAAKENGSLSDVKSVDDVPLVTAAGEWRDGRGVLVTTARSFKGLEADAVILYDLGGFSRLFRPEDLYVACTRAKVLLIAIVHGEECREVIVAAQLASEAEL